MQMINRSSGDLRLRRGAAALVALALAGCETSGRFSDLGGGRPVAPPPPREQTFIPAPTSRVETSTLPPVSSLPLPAPSGPNPELGGLPSRGEGVQPLPGLPPAGSSVPIDPEPMRPAQRQPEAPIPPIPPVADPAPRVASRPDPAPAAPSAPSRTSVIGNWSAREATGGNCRVTLSSAPSLDLYKASSSGCQSRELQRISAWELRGDEVYLYEPGGGVAARLKQTGRGYEGAAAKTGAPIALSK